MKKARINFSISMEVYFNERYTAEQIAEMFLDSDRFTNDVRAKHLAAFQAEPVRQIDLCDTEMGLIALAISTLANSKGLECLSGFDRVALAELEKRVARW